MRQDVYKRLGVDPMSRLRRIKGDQPVAETSELRSALWRVFKGQDGRQLLDYMILHSYGMTVAPDAPDSALREKQARQRFLDQILALAAEEPRELSQQPSQPTAPSAS